MRRRAGSPAGVVHGGRRGLRVRLQVRHREALRSARRQANRDLLDDGTLYVARFNADGSGDWLPLVHGQGPLNAAGGFRDQGEVVVRTRRAADLLGATGMDHPEWIVAHPVTREVFCACTGSATRGRDGHAGANPANRRAPNPFGHILRWREDGGDPAATRFRWEVFVQAGGPDQGGTITGDLFANPDALWIDSMGHPVGGDRRLAAATSARAPSRRSATISFWRWIPRPASSNAS